ncbi:DNA repair protein rad50 [Rhizina undulata]
MCGEKEVLAQVKLSFKSTSGARLICTRSLQLTVTRTGRSQKTLDGSLLVYQNGERSTISSRCAELDVLIPQYLGVSNAVLEYVIFCHQDESLWPLSEPATLKKRFDEIFEALKYTKAIGNIKEIRKKQVEELGKLKILQEQYRIDKDRGERAKRRADELHAEIEEMREEILRLTQLISENTKQQKELFATAKGFEEALASLNSKRQEYRSKEAYLEEMSCHLTHLEESDEDLQTMLREYGQRMQTFQDYIDAKRSKHAEANRDLESVRIQLSGKLTEVGTMRAEHMQYERHIQERASLIKEVSRRHNIKGFESELDDGQIREFIDKVSKMSKEQNKTLERIKREIRDKLETAQKELNQLIRKRSSLVQEKEYARAEIGSSDERATKLQGELDRMGVNEGQKIMQRAELDDKGQRLKKAKDDFEKAAFDNQIQIENGKLKQVEARLNQVTDELAKGTRQADDRARLGFFKKELNTRKKALDTLSAAHQGKISRIVGDKWSVDTLERELRSILESRAEEVAEVTQQRDGVNQELSQVETKKNMLQDSLKKMKAEMQKCERTVLQSWYENDGNPTDVKEYPKAVADIENSLQIARGNLKYLDFKRTYLQNALNVTKEYKACSLCKRGFEDAEIPLFNKRLEEDLQKLVRREAEKDIQDFEEDLKLVRNAAPSYDSYVRLSRTEIPALEEDLKRNQEARDRLVEQYNQYDKELNERAFAKANVEALKMPVAEITKFMREIAQYEAQIQEISGHLNDMGSARTIEEIQAEMQQLNNESNVIKRQISKIQSEKESGRQAITAIDAQVHNARMKLSEIQYKLQKSSDLMEQINELRQKNRESSRKVDQIDEQIKRLQPELTAAEARVTEIEQEGVEDERRYQREATKFAESDMQLKRADQSIRNYVLRGGPDNLERCQQESEALQAQVRELQEHVLALGEEVTNLEMEASNASATERSIHENLRFRKERQDLEDLANEIEELESRNIEEERDKYQINISRLGDKHMKLTTEKSAKAGEMKSKDKQLEQLIGDYATDYADAKIKFKETMIKVKATNAAQQDLLMYANALDKAIVRYHSIKMEEINRTIEELWRDTYRGTDIDKILIRSELGKGGNKAYDYKVVMIKQDVEMDMRGRCSAGQKVLASIIIRLALAECFGASCGLIALDEPTTNLDIDNIRSLAKSLHQIIQNRRSQANFQLLVITHDESFLKEMHCDDYCDSYYRVSRNERQKSTITKQTIAEVM